MHNKIQIKLLLRVCVVYALQKAIQSHSQLWHQAELLLPARPLVLCAIRYGKTYRIVLRNASLPLANAWITCLCSFLRLIRPTVSIAELVAVSVLFGTLRHIAYSVVVSFADPSKPKVGVQSRKTTMLGIVLNTELYYKYTATNRLQLVLSN